MFMKSGVVSDNARLSQSSLYFINLLTPIVSKIRRNMLSDNYQTVFKLNATGLKKPLQNHFRFNFVSEHSHTL